MYHEFLEEMDISESLKCSRKISFRYTYLKFGTCIVYGEFFYEDILQVSNLDYIFNEFLSKMAKKLKIWFQAQHVKNCHTKGIESTVSKLFPNNKDIMYVYS